MWPATSGRGYRLWFAGLCLTAHAFFISAQALQSQHLQENQKSKFTIERVEIVGNRRIETRTILDRISSRPGDPYDVEAVQRDVQALRDTGYFERVRLTVEDSPGRPEGKIVAFDVLEKPIGQNPPTCLSYEPSVVQLNGKIVRKIFPGPPNYESIERGDKAEQVWLLVLTQPICVEQDKEDPDLNPAQKDVRQIQLVFGDSGAFEKYRGLPSTKVTATGTLFGGHTGHHRTPVLLTVKTLAKTN